MKICLLGQEVWTGWVHLYEWPPFVGEGPFYMAPWDDGATWGHQVGVFLLAFLKASRQLASWPIVTLQFGPISWSVRSCHSPVIGVRSLSPASLSRAGWHCHFITYLGCALRIVGGGLLVQVSSPKFSVLARHLVTWSVLIRGCQSGVLSSAASSKARELLRGTASFITYPGCYCA